MKPQVPPLLFPALAYVTGVRLAPVIARLASHYSGTDVMSVGETAGGPVNETIGSLPPQTLWTGIGLLGIAVLLCVSGLLRRRLRAMGAYLTGLTALCLCGLLMGADLNGAVCWTRGKSAAGNLPRDRPVYLYLEQRGPGKATGKYMRHLCRAYAYRDSSGFHSLNEQVLCYIPPDRALPYRFFTRTIPRALTSFSSRDASEAPSFDYAAHMARQHCYCRVYPQRWRAYGGRPGPGRRIREQLQDGKRVTGDFYLQHFNPRAAGLLSGLTLGDKNLLPQELKEAYSAAGSMHLLSVSGLHVGVLYLGLQRALGLLGRAPWAMWLRSFWILGLLWGYAGLIGFPPSVCRALLMLTLLETGRRLLRPGDTLSALIGTGFLLCLLRPTRLWDLGFQLSFTAVLSLVLICPLLQGLWLPRNKVGQYLVSLFYCSVATQLGTLPLIAGSFGAFPVYGLITNLLLIPLGSGLLYLALCWIPLQLSWPQGGPTEICKRLLGRGLDFMNTTVDSCSHWPHATLSLQVNATQQIVLGLSILSFVLYATFRSKPVGLLLLAWALLLTFHILGLLRLFPP